MNKNTLLFCAILCGLAIMGCSNDEFNLADTKLILVNRDITSKDKATNSIALNNKVGDGMAILEEIDFQEGTLTIDLKGENTPGRSFVGVAFNIQNDSTYEAVYFRPFNFQSKEDIRRAHSIQYISHPKNTWRYLRTNFEGKYEAEFGRQPSPEEWFSVAIQIDEKTVSVYDKENNKELLSIDRIERPTSTKIGLWTGFNSKGEFRNLRVEE